MKIRFWTYKFLNCRLNIVERKMEFRYQIWMNYLSSEDFFKYSKFGKKKLQSKATKSVFCKSDAGSWFFSTFQIIFHSRVSNETMFIPGLEVILNFDKFETLKLIKLLSRLFSFQFVLFIALHSQVLYWIYIIYFRSTCRELLTIRIIRINLVVVKVKL